MKIRLLVSTALAALMVLTGGWLAGSYASGSGWVVWLNFTSGSANTPMCGQNQAYLTVGGTTVTYSATERSLNRSGSSCGTLRSRPVNNMQVTNQLIRDGVVYDEGYAWNPNSTPSATWSASGPRSGGTCFTSRATSAQYDSQNGGAWRTQSGYTSESA